MGGHVTQNHHVSLSISIDYCRKYQPEGDSEELYYSVTVDQLDLKRKKYLLTTLILMNYLMLGLANLDFVVDVAILLD